MPRDQYRPGSDVDFERLYRDCRGRLLQTVTAVVRDPTEAEDCVQETFERAYGAWPKFRPEAPAAAWLHRIAINVAISHRRRQSLRQVGETVRRLGRPSPAPDAASSTDTLDLVEVLRRIPPRQAVVIVLRHLHGYSNREIATALGVPERTVASRLAAAKRRLVADLAAYHLEGQEEGQEELVPIVSSEAQVHQHPMRGAPDV